MLFRRKLAPRKCISYHSSDLCRNSNGETDVAIRLYRAPRNQSKKYKSKGFRKLLPEAFFITDSPVVRELSVFQQNPPQNSVSVFDADLIPAKSNNRINLGP